MKRTIDEIENCRANLGLPEGAEQTLTAFHWARELLQPIQELQQLSEEESTALRVCLSTIHTLTIHFNFAYLIQMRQKTINICIKECGVYPMTGYKLTWIIKHQNIQH